MRIEKIITRSMATSFRSESMIEGALEHTYKLLNGRIIRQSANMGHDVTFKDESQDCNLLDEILYLCPVYCNFLMSRKYSNILFISHMDINERKWYLDGRPREDIDPQIFIDGYPPEKIVNKNYPDLDKVVHFIPTILRTWDFDTEATVARPSQLRYSGTIHEVYKRFNIESLDVNTQYEHGNKVWRPVKEEYSKYDAIVFLHVPSKDDKDFTLDQVKNTFSDYVTDDCEYVDLWNGDKSGRFLGANELSSAGDIMQVMNIKSESGGINLKSEEKFLNRHISVYK